MTKLGTILDPIADKVLAYGMLVVLCFESTDAWIAILFTLIFVRDLIVTGARIDSADSGKIIEASE